MRPFLRFVRLLPLAALAASPLFATASCNGQQEIVLSADGTDASADGAQASCTTDQACNEDPAMSTLQGRCINGTCTCNVSVVVTPSGKCGGTISFGPADAAPDAPIDDCVAKGGVCASDPVTPPPNYRPAGPGEGTCGGTDKCYVPVTQPTAPICYNDEGCNGDPNSSALWGTCFYGICVCKPGFTVQPNGKCHSPPPPACTTQKGTCRSAPAQCLADELASAPDTNVCGIDVVAKCCNKTSACVSPAREAAPAGWVPVEMKCCGPNDDLLAPICVNGFQTCPHGQPPVLASIGGCS